MRQGLKLSSNPKSGKLGNFVISKQNLNKILSYFIKVSKPVTVVILCEVSAINFEILPLFITQFNKNL